MTLLRWILGQRIDRRTSPRLVGQIGSAMAELHVHTEKFSLPDAYNRPHTFWDKLTYWQYPENDTFALLTAGQRQLCCEASHRLLSEIDNTGTEADFGLVHADLTLNNC